MLTDTETISRIPPASPQPGSPSVQSVPCRTTDARSCRVAIAIAAVLLEIDAGEIARSSRSPVPVCEARHIAMYLAHVVFQVSLIRASSQFGRDRTSIAHAVRRIEERRDEPEFDAKIEKFDDLARSIRAAMAEPAGRVSG